MPDTRRRPARDRILAAAVDLFYEHGIAATGIDAVVEHAGVARKSLYNNFASKDELVDAFIEHRHQQWTELHRTRVTAADDAGRSSALAKVLCIIDAYIDHAHADGDRFRGCGLLNTAAEFPVDSPARLRISRNKAEVEQMFTDALGTELGDGDAAATAAHLSFLIEGAVSRAGLDGTTGHLHRARTIAEATVTAACRTGHGDGDRLRP